MASNFDLSSEVQAELQCAVCFDSYTDPVTLTCGHSFCRECLLGVFMQCGKEMPTAYGPAVSYVECPICRDHYYTTVEKIANMSVNLSLRNIVSAIGDKTDDKPAICEKHRTPYCIYCVNCKSAKCLSCFVDGCFKNSHTTMEIDDMANEVRANVKSKLSTAEKRLQTLERSCKGEDAVVAQLQKVAKQELVAVVDMIGLAEAKALVEDSKHMKNMVDELKGLLKSSNSAAASSASRTLYLTVPDLTNGKVAALHGECNDLIVSIKQNVERLNAILKSHNIDPAMGAVSSTRPSVSASDLEEDSIVRALNRSARSSSTRSSSPEIVALHPGEEEIYRVDYPNVFIHSVSSLPSFVVNTARGCSYATYDIGAPWFLSGRIINDICLIGNTGRCLALVDNQIEIHDNEELVGDDMPPLYVLPTPNAYDACHFECVGVITRGEHFYVMSDTNNSCLRLWHAQDGYWCPPIDLRPHSSHPRPSFKMCVYLDSIFVSFHYEGVVIAFDRHGSVIWINDSCGRPNGLTANASGIYVCEGELGGQCIMILNLDGTYRLSILQEFLLRPWSVAVRDNTLLVLERFYRHNLRHLPMTVAYYRLNEF